MLCVAGTYDAGVSEAWKGGSTRQWRKVRQVVLDRNVVENDGACALAYPGTWHVTIRLPEGGQRIEERQCTGQATEVHHTLGKAVSGDDPRYLRGVCRPCNLRAGDPAAAPDPPVSPRTQWW